MIGFQNGCRLSLRQENPPFDESVTSTTALTICEIAPDHESRKKTHIGMQRHWDPRPVENSAGGIAGVKAQEKRMLLVLDQSYDHRRIGSSESRWKPAFLPWENPTVEGMLP